MWGGGCSKHCGINNVFTLWGEGNYLNVCNVGLCSKQCGLLYGVMLTYMNNKTNKHNIHNNELILFT